MDAKETNKKKLQVVVRIRPQQKPDNIWVSFVDSHRLRTINHRNVEEALEYDFEHVFSPGASQECVYDTCVQPLLKYVLQGQNASVFAYGPTGSGKTHTILGNDSAPGIIPQCVRDVFTLIECERKKPLVGGGCKFDVFYSYMEIYNEKVHDLLDPNRADLQIRQDRDQTLFVVGLSEKEIKSLDDFNQSFSVTSKKRTTAATKLNAHSSRSHAVLLLKINKTDMTCSPFRKLSSKIYIIDLAGSEDNRRTGNEGIRLKESGAINTSLFMLAEVVDALNKGKAVVPYRQSKLTRLLQDSLGGNSHSVMIVNVAPEERHYLDTVSTLKLARKSKKIVNTISTNEVTEKPLDEPKTVNVETNVPPVKKMSKAKKTTPKTTPSPPPAPAPGSIESNILSPLLRSQNILQAEFMRMKMELESVKSQISAASSMGDSAVSSTSQIGDSLIDSAICHQKESTPMVGRKRKPFADVDSLFNTPLVLPPSKRDKKQLKKDSSCATVKPLHVSKGGGFELDVKKERSVEVLEMLNGTLRDLKQLQKIGDKKARLIYDWRMLHGPLDSIAGLQEIPGFTGYKNFLQANLIKLD